jgi:YegS/Rv2252/BmrU family lipid kinase
MSDDEAALADDSSAAADADVDADPGRGDGDRWLILNPKSGSADHTERVRERAREAGFRVEETEEAGHATRLADEAVAAGAELLAVAGGDGTLHEVAEGLAAAEALDAVTVGVIPAGTENIFASMVGVPDLETGFKVLESGERRRLDVGFAGDEPFLMSCIAGLPADASVATSSEMKARLGSAAFLVTGVQEAAAFDGLQIDLTAVSDGEETRWRGEVLCVLVGNVRQFAHRGGQADVEDGLFDVVLVEQMPTSNLIEEAVSQRLFGSDTEHVRRLRANRLEIRGLEGDPINFSLDGELSEYEALDLRVRPRTLSVCVGPDYDPDPDPV